MSWSEIEGFLTELGWTQAELARRVGVHPNTVSAWAQGRRRVPGAVVVYLSLAMDVKRLATGLIRLGRV